MNKEIYEKIMGCESHHDELKICICKKKECERFGKCEECIAHHTANKKYPPYCMRVRKADKNKLDNKRKHE
jgi:hypothetical protein